MLDCISVETIRLSDQKTIAEAVSGLELMYRAAAGVFHAVSWHGRIGILAGSGNNGGDGFALACILQENGISCTVFTLSQRMSQDSAFYAQRAEAAGVLIQAFCPGQNCLNQFDILVDCLLGTGFHGSVREDYRRAIHEINTSGAYVVSVDINSGMNGDTGEFEVAVSSDLTVTIGFFKNGLLTPCAETHIRRLVCADIGILLVKEENKLCTTEEWQTLCASNSIPPHVSRIELAGTVYYPCPDWVSMRLINSTPET